MATKKTAGKVLDLTTQVLIDIRDELRRGFGDVNSRLDDVTSRLDNLRDIARDRYRELDARIRILESRNPH